MPRCSDSDSDGVPGWWRGAWMPTGTPDAGVSTTSAASLSPSSETRCRPRRETAADQQQHRRLLSYARHIAGLIYSWQSATVARPPTVTVKIVTARYALHGNYWVSHVTMLLDTWHKRTHQALTTASKIGTQFTYPRGMEGWVDLGALITSQPRIEPVTAWSKVQRPNRCAIKTADSERLCIQRVLV